MITWMLSGLQAVLIILIILLVITQTVSVRIRYDNRFIFDFDFTIVSFTLISRRTRRNSRSISNKIGVLSIIKLIGYVLEGSHVEINAMPRFAPNQGYPLAYGYTEILRNILLSYIDKKSASVSYCEAERLNQSFDITFKTSFYHLVCTLVLYFRECRKSRQKARARI